MRCLRLCGLAAVIGTWPVWSPVSLAEQPQPTRWDRPHAGFSFVPPPGWIWQGASAKEILGSWSTPKQPRYPQFSRATLTVQIYDTASVSTQEFAERIAHGKAATIRHSELQLDQAPTRRVDLQRADGGKETWLIARRAALIYVANCTVAAGTHRVEGSDDSHERDFRACIETIRLSDPQSPHLDLSPMNLSRRPFTDKPLSFQGVKPLRREEGSRIGLWVCYAIHNYKDHSDDVRFSATVVDWPRSDSLEENAKVWAWSLRWRHGLGVTPKVHRVSAASEVFMSEPVSTPQMGQSKDEPAARGFVLVASVPGENYYLSYQIWARDPAAIEAYSKAIEWMAGTMQSLPVRKPASRPVGTRPGTRPWPYGYRSRPAGIERPSTRPTK